MLLFHATTAVKVLRIVGLSVHPLVCLQKNAKLLAPLVEEGGGMGKGSEREEW